MKKRLQIRTHHFQLREVFDTSCSILCDACVVSGMPRLQRFDRQKTGSLTALRDKHTIAGENAVIVEQPEYIDRSVTLCHGTANGCSTINVKRILTKIERMDDREYCREDQEAKKL